MTTTVRDSSPALAQRPVRRINLLARHTELVALVTVWLVSRALMISELGYWRPGTEIGYQDVNVFQDWSNRIVGTHELPGEPAWQYPPGAVLVFLAPRLVPGHYQPAFVGLVLLADLVTATALVLMRRGGNNLGGAWLWVLTLPVLGSLALLRFDVVPTAIAVVALALGVTNRRLLGVVVGIGVAVKAWPILVLLRMDSLRTARRTVPIAAGTAVAFVVGAWLTLGNSLGFLGHHGARGLELEAVAATPWYLRQAITGREVHWVGRNGSLEINSSNADLVAHVLFVVMLTLAVALAAWWLLWTRSSASLGMDVGRDAVFTAVLLYVVVSEVLSPQYLIWLIGLGAVAYASPTCRVRRPIAGVVVATLLTRALLANWGDLVSNGANGAYLLSLRNAVLLAAALDAAWIMWKLVRSSHRQGLARLDS